MGLKDIGDLMQQAQAMQGKMQEMKEAMARAEVIGEAGAGLVKVVLNGANEARSVTIDPSLFGEDRAVLEDLLAAAFNDAVRKVGELQQQNMAGLASGLGLPTGGMPFSNLFGK